MYKDKFSLPKQNIGGSFSVATGFIDDQELAMEGLDLNVKLKAFTFLMLVSSTFVVYAQPGFTSIACGGGEKVYNDSRGIQWTSDSLYIESGEINTPSPQPGINGSLDYPLQHLRSFPQGKQNCYVLPVNQGTKYLIRTSFLYGNYDGLLLKPQFEVLIDANPWDTIMINNTWDISVKEAIIMTRTISVSICLARSGTDTPFISSLELRPIKPSMYPVVNFDFSLFGIVRGDWGAPLNSSIRYPDDAYDRIWSGQGKGTELVYLTTTNKIDPSNTEVPSSVLSTALATSNATVTELMWNWNFGQAGLYYFALTFAELEELKPNDKREFNITVGGTQLYGNEEPTFLLARTISSNPSNTIHAPGLSKFSLDATHFSTLSPLINAWEVYRYSSMLVNGTYANDVVDIVRHFNMEKDWTGDPCIPQKYSWNWVNCSSSSSPRIIAVKLSGKDLNGTIPASVGNLSALIELDLSNNNLSGSIPEELTQLSNLIVVNLANNKLTGSVPEGLENTKLNLSIYGNDITCQSNACNNSPKMHSKKTVAVLVITAEVAAVAVFAALVVFITRMKPKKPLPSTFNPTRNRERTSMREDLMKLEGCQSYSYEEVIKMTVNFRKQIGIGGFGPVYAGRVQKKEVAVKKLSENSYQGTTEFSTEVDMLSRVQHKNLVKFIGYCLEEENMILIYEFMSNGDLRRYLNGQNSSGKCLDWETRIKIALDAAQGLEYLHRGSKPAIIHRDLRGTRGYIDPEYYIRYHLTEKSDVYSFGVVLLEIISGRNYMISEPSKPRKKHIATWARKYLMKGDIESIADPFMGKKYNVEDLRKLIELAMTCCSDCSAQRPTMSEVVLELKKLMGFPSLPFQVQSFHSGDEGEHRQR
ncbi:hypothetical protein SUGI_0962080 [Cryptomeria japonica]|nr:hypothetical protein SUGI_0962080 [Cryptomeria japonica]